MNRAAPHGAAGLGDDLAIDGLRGKAGRPLGVERRVARVTLYPLNPFEDIGIDLEVEIGLACCF